MPFHQRGGAPDNLDRTRVLQAAQAKFDWIDAGRGGQFIDEAFDGEAVRRLAGRADGGRAQRRVLEPMRNDLDALGRIWRITVLRNQPRVEPRHVVEAGSLGSQQWNVR